MLTVRQIQSFKTPGRYSDGQGLILSVQSERAKSWIVRVQHNGRRRDFGLGSYPDVSLAEAREKAIETRKLVRAGKDPKAEKRALRASEESPATFRQAALQAHAVRKAGWRNAKHRAQWLTSLKTYAFPTLGDLPVEGIETRHIVEMLLPIWLSKPETARRVRQRTCAVLDWAHAKDLRTREAPSRSISMGLPKQARRQNGFPALHYDAAPKLMADLSKKEAWGSLALAFLIYTAARSGEVRHATWGEIDLSGRLWTVPAHRMKAGRQHVVPLSDAAMAILAKVRAGRKGKPEELIFPGRGGKPLSDMTLSGALHRVTDAAVTVHGFRSTFRDWAAEAGYPDRVVETALAHINPNRVEASYLRSDFRKERIKLMAEWANHLSGAK